MSAVLEFALDLSGALAVACMTAVVIILVIP